MKDAYNTEIKVGDIVVTCLKSRYGDGNQSGVLLGLVTGFTAKKVKINHRVMNMEVDVGLIHGQDEENRLCYPEHIIVYSKGSQESVNEVQK